MAAVLDTAPNAASDFMSVRGVCEYAGITRNSVFHAINKGRLHPLRAEGSSRFLFLRGEVLAWRHRYTWRPTPEELAALLAQGYKAEDFTPATPGEPASPLDALLGATGGSSRASASPTPTGGAVEASGALVSMSDLRAYAETQWREGQMFAAGAAPVAGSAAEGVMRGWAQVSPGVSISLDDLAGVASSAAEGAMRPILETIRASLAPLSETVAQAALPRLTPPPDDVVARQMNVLRVELAQLLTRMMEAIRPMVERLAAGGYVTLDDTAPFLHLLGELASTLAGSPLYDPAQAMLAQLPELIESQGASTPAPTASEGNASE